MSVKETWGFFTAWLDNQITPLAAKKWGHAIAVGVVSGCYDGLAEGKSLGHLLVKNVGLSVAIRVLGAVGNLLGD